MVDAAADLDAVDARHHHVEHDEVGAAAVDGVEQQERGGAVGGLDDLEAVGFEHGAHDAADRVVVVDDEHDRPAPARRRLAVIVSSDSTRGLAGAVAAGELGLERVDAVEQRPAAAEIVVLELGRASLAQLDELARR